MKLDDLIKENEMNHYHLMVVVENKSNPQAEEKVIKPLLVKGWQMIDVEEKVLEVSKSIPPEKLSLRFMDYFKTVIQEQIPEKSILVNVDVLYDIEIGSPDPINTFKYQSRTKEMIVIVRDAVSSHLLTHSEYGNQDYKTIDMEELVYCKVEEIDA